MKLIKNYIIIREIYLKNMKKFICKQVEKLKKIIIDCGCEIANVIYFLASDEASYVNSETIVIDGGH